MQCVAAASEDASGDRTGLVLPSLLAVTLNTM